MRVRKTLLYLIAFVSGAVVLALEIVAGRFLAPKFGGTVQVWGNLIAVFLAGLSVGYYAGGHLADRHASAKGFATVLFLSAVVLLTMPLYAGAVRDAVFNYLDLESVETVGPLLTSMGLFFLPTTFLGMVSPYAVRLLADDPSKLGRHVGTLYALSTIGSIVGAIGTTFFLFVWMGALHLRMTHLFVLFGLIQGGLAIVALGCGSATTSSPNGLEPAGHSRSSPPD